MRSPLFPPLFGTFSGSLPIHRFHGIYPTEEAMFGQSSPLTPSLARHSDGHDSRQALIRRVPSPSSLSRIATVLAQLPIHLPSSSPFRYTLTHSPRGGDARIFTPNTHTPSLCVASLRESSRRHQLASVHSAGRSTTPEHSGDTVLSLRRTVQLPRATASSETSHHIPRFHLREVSTEPAADSLSLSVWTPFSTL